MSPNALKNQLIYFLRLHGILKQYMDNVSSNGNFPSMLELCERVERKYLIAYSFNWNKSKEGKKYWTHYHNIWVKSGNKKFCKKPDSYMMPYSVGQVIKHPTHGDIVAHETDGGCSGCVFLIGKHCKNDGSYGCTPYGRGDNKNVIFKKYVK